MMINIFVLVSICVILGSFGQIYMKKGLKNRPIDIQNVLSTKIFYTITEPNVFLGFFFYLLGSVIWLTVLSKADVSFVYPLISLGYILTAILARIYFNENISFIRWFGILLVIGGVFLITRS